MTSARTSTSMNGVSTKNDIAAKEQPLIDDIRLLGQVLGDTIRDQEGEATFELIETIRKLSIACERNADPDAPHRLGTLLRGLTVDQAMAVSRAFTYFSHLANIAEDRHYIRRRAVHGMQQPETRESGSLAASFEHSGGGRLWTGGHRRRRWPWPRIAGSHRASDRGPAQEPARRGAFDRAAFTRAWHARKRAGT